MAGTESTKPKSAFEHLMRQTDIVFTFALFGIVLLLILPVSPKIIDFLLAVSIGFSLFVLLIVVYLKDPAEFSVFPTLLLAITLYRLGLNVASTRLILLDGYAGNVIDSFGNYVVRGNYVVGAVVFMILVIINFVVITKGAGRIAEVAARFTLDAMPGKQMAIDAELNAGLIDETLATRRRLKVQKEADFYGAMDGASKFVRGDAVAGLLITFVNVVGGIAIGVLQKGLPLVDSLKRYTLLSIGDGLVSQIPALIVSLGAGILITRTSEEINLGEHFGRQLLIYPKAVAVAATMMFVFSVMPGMPFTPFAMLGIILGIGSQLLKKAEPFFAKNESFAQTLDQKQKGQPAEGGKKAIEDAKATDTPLITDSEVFSIELGFGLLRLADKAANGDLLDRITGIRQKLGRDLGFFVPPITVKDNFDLGSNEYRFLLRGKQMARNRLEPNRWLAMRAGVEEGIESVKGIETLEPVFGLKAWWIEESEKPKAEITGYTVVDSTSVVITHLSEILKTNAYLLLTREDTQKLIDGVKVKNPTLIAELFPDLIHVGVVQRVFQNLLKEGIGLKNLTLILETIADFATFSKHPDDLTEQCRRHLGIYFVENYIQNGYLTAIILDPRLEQSLAAQVKRTQFEIGLLIEPILTQTILKQLTPLVTNMIQQSIEPLVLVTGELRLAFKRFFEPSFPKLTVLSYQELPHNIQIRNYGVISLNDTKENVGAVR